MIRYRCILTVFYVSGRLCTIGAVWQPKNSKSLHSYQFTSTKGEVRKVQCVCLCDFESACSVLCVTPVLFLFFLLVLLFVPSFVYVCHGVSGCGTSSSSWLFQEMHLIVLGSEVNYLPPGHPTPHPPFFNKFYQLLTGSKAPLCTEVGTQVLLLCMIHAEK